MCNGVCVYLIQFNAHLVCVYTCYMYVCTQSDSAIVLTQVLRAHNLSPLKLKAKEVYMYMCVCDTAM